MNVLTKDFIGLPVFVSDFEVAFMVVSDLESALGSNGTSITHICSGAKVAIAWQDGAQCKNKHVWQEHRRSKSKTE